MRWNRRLTLPAEARDALPLDAGERLLAVARLVDGSWVAATPGALVLPGHRVDWSTVAHAEWSDERSQLRVDLLRTADAEAETHRLALDEPGRVPEVVRDRVTSSIVASRHTPVEGRAGVRVVARRVPGEDELQWQVVVDRGLDPADPRVQTAGDTAVSDLRRDLGL
jgi:hypothetical protein